MFLRAGRGAWPSAHYFTLFKFGHDGAAAAAHEEFCVRAVAAVEADFPILVLGYRDLAVGRGGFERGGFFVDYYHVFVVEVHRRGFPGIPAVAPDDDAIRFVELLHVWTGKRERVRGRVGERRDGMVFELDDDGVFAGLARRFAFVTERSRAFVSEGDSNEIMFGRRESAADVPDGDAFIVDEGLGGEGERGDKEWKKCFQHRVDCTEFGAWLAPRILFS